MLLSWQARCPFYFSNMTPMDKITEEMAAFANKAEHWTDGTDGVPYLWTNSGDAKDAARSLVQSGVPCKTFKVERYAYGIERKDDGRMVSQSGRQALALPV